MGKVILKIKKNEKTGLQDLIIDCICDEHFSFFEDGKKHKDLLEKTMFDEGISIEKFGVITLLAKNVSFEKMERFPTFQKMQK